MNSRQNEYLDHGITFVKRTASSREQCTLREIDAGLRASGNNIFVFSVETDRRNGDDSLPLHLPNGT
jgi:hypothetical protein